MQPTDKIRGPGGDDPSAAVCSRLSISHDDSTVEKGRYQISSRDASPLSFRDCFVSS